MRVNLQVMMKALLVMSLLFLTSCSDIKEVQNMNYVTAIGVDFKDDEYIGYIQLISFSSQGENGSSREPSVWVSETKGKTFDEALSLAYNTSQERLLWAHVNTILVSETALEEGFHHIFDVLTRYYELRLTTWIFGTNAPIKEVFSTTSFFNQSALATVLHRPMGTFEQNSTIRPIKLQQFVRELYEPALTTYLPSIRINESHWVHNMKPDPKLEIDGAFFLKNKAYKGFYTLEELKGLRWLSKEMERAGIQVMDEEGEPDFNIVFEKNKVDIQPLEEEGSPRFYVKVSLEGVIANRDANKIVNLKEMEANLREEILKEIKSLYKLGIKSDTDFFRLEHILYRNKNERWNSILEDGGFTLTENLLEEIDLNVKVIHSGALKNRTINMEDID
ncbi:Ger(x)C family spore germination protein [Sutcliffiella horikoshii]|uniref:Ger(x)C family spore germination protein n=1 Tax=Sutcliffiella horikoshii TaxID=79883 RepID=UPI001EED54D8|nr:Ger(x)C family spore germination protein [Sutcliffiella horikoshii]MCG1023748.1 Ger(x)C family spore germination protein [Sutcliffiella horikoshii]